MLAITAAALLLAAILLLAQRRRGRVHERRAALLSACAPLFADPVQRLSPMGFPRMAGTAHGLRFDVQLVPDALALRKLPTLWLLVSLPVPQPVSATLHLMLRPTGAEGFSHFNTLPEQLDLPPDFPPDAALRSSTRSTAPSPDLMRPVLQAIPHDRLKEVVISPRGLRLTLLADEADRTNYLILRQTDLGQHKIDPALMQHALAALHAMHLARKASAHRKRA